MWLFGVILNMIRGGHLGSGGHFAFCDHGNCYEWKIVLSYIKPPEGSCQREVWRTVSTKLPRDSYHHRDLACLVWWGSHENCGLRPYIDLYLEKSPLVHEAVQPMGGRVPHGGWTLSKGSSEPSLTLVQCIHVTSYGEDVSSGFGGVRERTDRRTDSQTDALTVLSLGP